MCAWPGARAGQFSNAPMAPGDNGATAGTATGIAPGGGGAGGAPPNSSGGTRPSHPAAPTPARASSVGATSSALTPWMGRSRPADEQGDGARGMAQATVAGMGTGRWLRRRRHARRPAAPSTAASARVDGFGTAPAAMAPPVSS